MGHESYTGQIQLIFLSSFFKNGWIKGNGILSFSFLLAFLLKKKTLWSYVVVTNQNFWFFSWTELNLHKNSNDTF